MSCVAAWQQQAGHGAGAGATVLVTQLAAGVPTWVMHMGARLWALYSEMARIVWVAQPAVSKARLMQSTNRHRRSLAQHAV